MRLIRISRPSLRGAAIATVVSAITFVAVTAQQRSQAPPSSMGTAELSGTIVTDEANPRPVRRAVVTLSLTSLPISRATTTDDAGRFAFLQLPAGNYSAPRATKPGFVSATYGEKRVNGMGTPITLEDGQRLAITLKMFRGAVITGQLVDQGRPAAFASVQATAVRIVNGVRVVQGAYYSEGGGYATTDDRGVYRLYGLPPGDYIVAVSGNSAGATGAAMRPITDAEMQWAQQQVQGGSGSGAVAPSQTSVPPPAQAVTSAPVYYPGTTVVAQAALVTLAAGQERSGIDFSLRVVPTARIDGIVLGPDGQPAAAAQINLIPRVDTSGGQVDSVLVMNSMFTNRASVTEGKFSFASVRPGDYRISARGAPRSDGPAPVPSGRGGLASNMTLWANADISVNGVDQNDVVLRLVPGVDIPGRVAFDAGDTERPADLSVLTVRLRLAPTPGITTAGGAPMAPVNADGTFTIKGVTPGRYFVYSYVPTNSNAPVWTMKSARVGDIDAGDIPFEVAPNTATPEMVVTYTDKVGELSGRLLDGANKPTSQLSIILFPTDKAMWSQASRRIRLPVRPATDGGYKFGGLVAGEYYLAALSDFDMADVYKPEFLEEVAAVATKITIGHGEKKVQDLKIAGGLR